MKSKTYEEFVEKFKPKKTTDDCYTPPEIYEAVKDWVVKEYFEGRSSEIEIARPFYPGGDYENYEYKENTVVIDNPPFSILAKIIDFYLAKKIRFFLFAPHLTLFSGNRDVCHIVIDKAITYENRAKVNTAFMTNLEASGVRLCPELRECICKNEKTKVNHVKYEYPPNVITSTSLGFIVKRKVKLKIKRDECYFLRSLDAQKKIKKAIFDGGFLISNRLANIIKKHREVIGENEKKESIVLELSQNEKEIIEMLEKSDKKDGKK